MKQSRWRAALARSALVAVFIVAAGCLEDGVAERPSSPSGPLTVTDVNVHRDSLVGQRLRVFGRIHVQSLLGDSGSDAPGPTSTEKYAATLHLVNPDEPRGALNILDLYRSGSDGRYEPLTCRMGPGPAADCGKYVPESLMTIEGVWRREQIPSGQVVHPDGRVEVIAWRTVYFLIVN